MCAVLKKVYLSALSSKLADPLFSIRGESDGKRPSLHALAEKEIAAAKHLLKILEINESNTLLDIARLWIIDRCLCNDSRFPLLRPYILRGTDETRNAFIQFRNTMTRFNVSIPNFALRAV